MISDFVLAQKGNHFVIYDAGYHQEEEEGLKRRIVSLGQNSRLSRWVGFYFLLLALIGLFSFAGPAVFPLAKVKLSEWLNREEVMVKKSGFAQLMWEEGNILAPESREFGLVIPKIGVNAKVVAGVNAADKTEYLDALSQGIAHAAGSSLPAENGLIYLFGHSTDYLWNVPELNALFYQLKDLEEGDLVSLIYQGERFDYKVTEKKIVEADDLSVLAPVDEERLVLQTCWPPGTTWKRLVVIARPEDSL